MRTIIFALLMGVAHIASAQVVITEIMYDPQGSDTGHEWVEVMNEGTSPVSMNDGKAGWRFVTGIDSHLLTMVQGGVVLAPSAYAIIANDAQKFLADHPGFAGAVFDSSFSLKNTGDTIGLKLPDGTTGDTVTYSNTQGAAGDGNSLQKVNGVWQAGTPTPGAGFVKNSSISTHNTASPQTAPGTTFSQNISNFPVEPQIIAEAGVQARTAIVGAPSVFTGKVLGLKREPIENARLVWTFGDGGTAEGMNVLHTYYYPGEYTVVLDGSSGYYTASDRTHIVAVVPKLALVAGGDSAHSFVSIENHTSSEIDLSGWQVSSGGRNFILPKNTILDAERSVTLASEITGLSTATTTTELRFPNGTRAPLEGSAHLISSETVKSVPLARKGGAPEENTILRSASVAVHKESPKKIHAQEASVIHTSSDAGAEYPRNAATTEGDSVWLWYASTILFGVGAFGAFLFVRSKETLVDKFEISDDKNDTPW